MHHSLKGFVLLYTLVTLMVVGILLSTLTFFTQSRELWLNNFYKEEQQLILKHCLKKDTIILSEPLILENSFHQKFTLRP